MSNGQVRKRLSDVTLAKTGCTLLVLNFSKWQNTSLGILALDIGSLYRGGVACGGPAFVLAAVLSQGNDAVKIVRLVRQVQEVADDELAVSGPKISAPQPGDLNLL